jgi:hypothetical protein
MSNKCPRRHARPGACPGTTGVATGAVQFTESRTDTGDSRARDHPTADSTLRTSPHDCVENTEGHTPDQKQ